MKPRGSLAIVGLGMTLGAHLTPRSRRLIEDADVVFVAVSDPIVELWVQGMHPDVRSLQPLYADGKNRQDTYREMVDTILAQVRAGRRVCGAFYGHPGVFAQAPHRAVRQARREGFEAVMEAGVSAEDCLYADLGIDPGRVGCQHYEASHLMLYERRIDSSAYLVVWQAAVAGDRSFRRFATGSEHVQLLVDTLTRDYPLDHPCILYEASTLPIREPRIETLPLRELPAAELRLQSTLVLPPALKPVRNLAMLAKLDALEAALAGKD